MAKSWKKIASKLVPTDNKIEFTTDSLGSFAIKKYEGRLPEGYQELAYLEGTSAQYIPIGITSSSNELWVAKVAPLNNGIWSSLFLATGKEKEDIMFATNEIALCTSVGVVPQTYAEFTSETPYIATVSIVNNAITLTVDEVSVSGTLRYPSYQWCLFARNTGGNMSAIRIYYANHYDASGNLDYQFIPCKRLSDGAIGMYELVNNEFKANATSTPFIYGEL